MGERGAIGSGLLAVLAGAAGVGLLVGTLLGVTGTVSLLGESGTVADPANASYFDCPDGTAIGTFGRGDRVLITGQDDSGDWVEVRSPEAANARVWMRSSQVLADGDTSGLPVVGCNVPVIVTLGEIPVDTTTTTTDTTVPVDTTTPTVALPTVGTVTSTNNPIWEADPGDEPQTCDNQPTRPVESVIRAAVTAPAGVQSVMLHWSVNGFTGSKPMGASGSDYVGILGEFFTDTPNAVPDGQTRPITVIVRVTDNLGRQAERQTTVTLTDCAPFG